VLPHVVPGSVGDSPSESERIWPTHNLSVAVVRLTLSGVSTDLKFRPANPPYLIGVLPLNGLYMVVQCKETSSSAGTDFLALYARRVHKSMAL
jgi:hypothetical protein